MDIAAAQDAFERGGSLSRIDLRVRPGVDGDALRERIERALPPGVAVATPQDNAAATMRMSRAYRVNLNVLALVALFTGGLLVFSTQALSVVRRRAQFALLRMLGVTRARLAALLVGEGALIGAAGALVGLAGGYALALVALRVVGADLGAGFFRGVAPQRRASIPRRRSCSALVGVAVAALGSLAAGARSRARGARGRAQGRRRAAGVRAPARPAPGLGMLAAGAASTLLPPVAGLPLFGYLAIALLLIGTLMLMPRLAAFVLARVPAPRAVPARARARAAARRAGQVGVSLATIVASVTPDGVDGDHGRVVPRFARRLARAHAAGRRVRARGRRRRQRVLLRRRPAQARGAAGRRARRVPARAELLLDPARPRVVLLARDLPRDDPGSALPLVGDAGRAARRRAAAGLGRARRWSTSTACAPGARLQLPIAGERTTVHRRRRLARLRAAAGRDRRSIARPTSR